MSSEQEESSRAPLTQEEKLWAFRKAANSMEGSKQRWSDRVASGLTDDQLADAIKYESGEMGSHCGERVGVTYQGSGLKVWADRCIGSRRNAPIVEGQATERLARDVYGIPDPNDTQGRLF